MAGRFQYAWVFGFAFLPLLPACFRFWEFAWVFGFVFHPPAPLEGGCSALGRSVGVGSVCSFVNYSNFKLGDNKSVSSLADR